MRSSVSRDGDVVIDVIANKMFLLLALSLITFWIMVKQEFQ